MDDAVIEKVSSQGIHYVECQTAGSPAVLLIHGLGANRLSWQYQMEALAKAGCRCIAPDLPGFGSSPAGKGHLRISKLADSMIALLDELVIPSAVVVGLSMGGTVALTMGLKYPDRVESLGLVSTFSQLRPTSTSELRYFLRRIWVILTQGLSSQAEVVAKRVFPGEDQEALRIVLEGQIRQADPATYRGVMRSLGTFNVTRRLKELHMPVIVISGADDTTVPVKVQQQLADRISGATHVTISHAGHGVIADQPEAFNAVLVDFIQHGKENA